MGQVAYCCWCDDEGKVVDDGTVTRLDERRFRLTAAEPSWSWLARFAHGYRVEIEDSTARIAALSVQGPTSRAVLSELASADLNGLRFFHGLPAALEAPGGRRIEAWISRTGYTGDLGFEVWVDSDDALALWDGVLGAGRRHGAEPAGLDAMDVARVEAGFLMNGVDYWSAHHCLIERRKSTPLELGLGWTVDLDRGPFAGRSALAAEKANGPAKRLVGLELDWEEYEALHAEYGLPPSVPAGAWRTPVPLYDDAGRQVGQATSGAWSPILKRNLALASVRADLGRPGTRLQMEVTVEHDRRRVTATVVRKPFFDPERKRA
jgi:aminomethyltransferase